MSTFHKVRAFTLNSLEWVERFKSQGERFCNGINNYGLFL